MSKRSLARAVAHNRMYDARLNHINKPDKVKKHTEKDPTTHEGKDTSPRSYFSMFWRDWAKV